MKPSARPLLRGPTFRRQARGMSASNAAGAPSGRFRIFAGAPPHGNASQETAEWTTQAAFMISCASVSTPTGAASR